LGAVEPMQIVEDQISVQWFQIDGTVEGQFLFLQFVCLPTGTDGSVANFEG
jgi:hypothetical protein